MAYGCFIDREGKREKICSLGDSADAMAGDVLEVLEDAPLYTSLCDLMGLDLYQVMVEIGNSETPGEVAAGYSYLFLDREFMDAYAALDGDAGKGGAEAGRDFTELRGLFDWLHYLKAWFAGMQEDDRLRDPERFRSYAEHILGTPVPVLLPVENAPADARLRIDPMWPDYRAVTDAFMESVDAGGGEDIFLADSFREVLVMELYQLLSSGETVSVCRNCGKPFAAFNRSDTFYCDRLAPQDGRKSCKEYGAYYVRLEKVRHDEATHIYKQVYNCLQNRYRRTKTPESPEGNARLKADAENFLAGCREWKGRIRADEATEQDYIIWLNQRKEEIRHG